MTGTANNYGNPNWTSSAGQGPWSRFGGRDQWGHGPWGAIPPWVPPYAAKPLLIAAMILGFVFWWPIGLILLAVLLWNKRMICGHRHGWRHGDASWSGWKNWSGGAPPSSGNSAFDEYRAETLRRLEEEQKEFGEFLNRLRVAKDKAEFDQFMNERRNRPEPPPAQPNPA